MKRNLEDLALSEYKENNNQKYNSDYNYCLSCPKITKQKKKISVNNMKPTQLSIKFDINSSQNINEINQSFNSYQEKHNHIINKKYIDYSPKKNKNEISLKVIEKNIKNILLDMSMKIENELNELNPTNNINNNNNAILDNNDNIYTSDYNSFLSFIQRKREKKK